MSIAVRPDRLLRAERRRSRLTPALLATLALLAAAGLAVAGTTPPATYGVAKDRGFTIQPPWARGKTFGISCAYGCLAHNNTGTQDHFALDFSMPGGEPVYPVAPGRVLMAQRLQGGWEPYGNGVYIQHQNGYQSLYAHLASISVTVGQEVDVGTPLGTAGQTGSGATSDHLHFVLYKGAVVGTDISGHHGPSGGSATVPEPWSGCTRSGGGDCESTVAGHYLRRDDFAPEAIVHPSGTLDLFTCARSNGNLLHRQRTAGGTWSGWTNMGGTCGSSPTAVRDASGRVYVFVRGLDGRLYFQRRDTNTGGWNGWFWLDGPVRGRAAAVLDGPLGGVRVFARRAPDDALYYAAQSGTGFTGWTSLGGTLVNSPVAGIRPDGHIDVFVAGLDYSLWMEPALSGGGFAANNWVWQGVHLEGEPGLVTEGAYRWAIRSTGDQIVLQPSTAVAGGTHPPAAARGNTGATFVFRRDPADSSADYFWVWPWGASGSGSFGGLVTSELEAVRAGSGQRVLMFTWGTGGLYYREQSSASGTTDWYGWADLQVPN